jgi:uncharacterized surface protein with fasciclin (FAS1) repeats
LASFITGPLATSSFDFVGNLNSTSNSTSLTVFAPTNEAFARILNNTVLTDLLAVTEVGNVNFLEFAIANHILPNISANSSVITTLLLQSDHAQHLLIDFDLAATTIQTLAGLNISITGVVQNGTSVPTTLVPPLLFVQNAFVVTPNAIVAENGVVHIISNVIDPFILATGGFFGPTREVVEGLENTLGPLVNFIRGFLTMG